MTKLELVLSLMGAWTVVSTVFGVVVGKTIRWGIGPEFGSAASIRAVSKPRRVKASFSPMWRSAAC